MPFFQTVHYNIISCFTKSTHICYTPSFWPTSGRSVWMLHTDIQTVSCKPLSSVGQCQEAASPLTCKRQDFRQAFQCECKCYFQSAFVWDSAHIINKKNS
ncbi:hypothetical protein KIL84_007360 [Mauremys mutica]|uniref:Uncharacterized protein n=1 Tax=Mauremys mutica TaxID=74926 RepID=A0A9D3X160_9SAUR|nr:hypothetical protein KIL84_007360 [Mauremys mutica]